MVSQSGAVVKGGGIKKHRTRTFSFDDSFYVEIVQRNSTYRWLRRYDFRDDFESAMIFDAEAPYWATIRLMIR